MLPDVSHLGQTWERVIKFMQGAVDEAGEHWDAAYNRRRAPKTTKSYD
jgi:hypothetical protein